MTKRKVVDLPIIGVVPARLAADPAILALQRMAASIQIVGGVACWDHMVMYELRDMLVELKLPKGAQHAAR